MEDLQASNKIRFLHIPKTAGSSFDECLFIQYLNAYVLRRRFTFTGNFNADRQRYRQIPPETRGKIVLYTGHSPLRTGISEVDCLPTITFLRNPIDRVISHCQHASEGKSLNMSGHIDYKDMDIDQFLSSGRTQLSNFQSKLLLGREGYNLPKGNVDELADQAIYVLEHELSCFGITEEFDRSLLLFSRVLSWEKPPIYRYRNIKNANSLLRFEAKHIDRIKELNQIDLLVYERARILFDKKIQEQGKEFESRLARFQQKLKGRHAIFPVIDFARYLRKLFF
jgi:hypothetical protein